MTLTMLDKLKMRQTFYNQKWEVHRSSLQFDNVFGKQNYLYHVTGMYLLELYNYLTSAEPPAQEVFHHAH